MYKFEIDDTVQTTCEVQLNGGDVVLAGSTGKVVKSDTDSITEWAGYIAISMSDGVRIGKLTYFDPQTLQVVSQNNTPISVDLEKRVSETRDDLLRDVFS